MTRPPRKCILVVDWQVTYLHLQLGLLAIAGVAAGGQRAAAALEVGGTDVGQHENAGGGMAVGPGAENPEGAGDIADSDAAAQQFAGAGDEGRGHLERLRRVRLWTLPSWHQDSRRRMQGGELRFLTDSMYMGTHFHEKVCSGMLTHRQ